MSRRVLKPGERPLSDAEVTARYAKRMKRKGGRRLTVWVDPEAAAVVAALEERGQGIKDIVQRGIIRLGRLEGVRL
jgi:hypothetical protein